MKKLLAINLQVQCTDGNTHENVKLYAENNRRIYVLEDGSELTGVDCVQKCTAIVPPTVLASYLYACKECE